MPDHAPPAATRPPTILDAAGRPGPARFAALPEAALPEPVNSASFAPAQLAGYLDLLCTPLRTPVESAWIQLGPVMLVLMAALRPRRYVELGSHRGFSYFAACQGAALAGTGTECVAVDTWQGDAHAGHYGEEVYALFRHLLARDHAKGPHFHIRALFDDAAACFDHGAIDLLLIDGLHTLDAVAHDFEVWRPRMSSRGVIMFHDTQVFSGDFGVWQLWERLAAEFPAFNILHGHGLGLIYTGAPNPALAALLAGLNADEGRQQVLQGLLHGIGRLSATLSDDRRRRDRGAKLAAKLGRWGARGLLPLLGHLPPPRR